MSTTSPSIHAERKSTLDQVRDLFAAAEVTHSVTIVCACGPTKVAVATGDTPEDVVRALAARRRASLPHCNHPVTTSR